jgi:hypothetical protein
MFHLDFFLKSDEPLRDPAQFFMVLLAGFVIIQKFLKPPLTM